MEKDTPGQILGVTHKSDGKSEQTSSSSSSARSSSSSGTQSPPIAERFTQKASDEDAYTSHDTSDTHEHRDAQKEKRYFYAGAASVVIFGLYYLLLSGSHTSYVDYERDRTLREQREEAAIRDKQMASGLFTADNMPRSA